MFLFPGDLSSWKAIHCTCPQDTHFKWHFCHASGVRVKVDGTIRMYGSELGSPPRLLIWARLNIEQNQNKLFFFRVPMGQVKGIRPKRAGRATYSQPPCSATAQSAAGIVWNKEAPTRCGVFRRRGTHGNSRLLGALGVWESRVKQREALE